MNVVYENYLSLFFSFLVTEVNKQKYNQLYHLILFVIDNKV